MMMVKVLMVVVMVVVVVMMVVITLCGSVPHSLLLMLSSNFVIPSTRPALSASPSHSPEF